MLKTAVLLNNFVIRFQHFLVNRNCKRTAIIWNKKILYDL